MSIATRIESMENNISKAYKSLDDLGVNLYKLPEEYQQVEYIESSGVEYINSGYQLNSNTSKIILKSKTINGLSHYRCLFGYENDRINRFFLRFQPNNNGHFYTPNNYTIKNMQIDKINNIEIDIFNNKTKCNGTETATSIKINNSSLPLFIFTLNYQGGPASDNFSTMQLYTFQVYENNNIVRNLIPCYRKSDNEIGLYDLVTNTFLTNAGTGTFTAGEIIREEIDKNLENISTKIDEVYDMLPKVTGTGTDITLNNTKKGRINIDLKGNTEQEQLTGKNKLQITATIETKNGLTLTVYNDKTFKVTGTINTDTAFNFVLVNMQNFEPFLDKQMCLSCGYSITNNMGAIVSNFYDNNIRVLASNAFNITSSKGYTTKTFSSSTYDISNGINIRVTLFIPEGNNGEAINISGYIQLEEGTTATSYEPYCGGIPSPNPDYPQQIKNVTGNANVKIQNKNLAWNGWAEDYVSRINNSELANLETYENRNCLRYNAGAGSGDYDNKYIFKINWKENTQYTLSYYAKSSQGYLNLSIEYTDGTTSSIDGTPITNWAKVTLTSTANKTIKYIRARFTAGATYIDLDTFMVEENSTATTYVPHQEQNYPFTFAEGQRGMQGTTLQDDGIHNVRKQIVLTGNEYFLGTDPFYVLIQGIKRSDAEIIVNSNYFKGTSFNDRIAEGNSNIVYSDGTYIYFRFTDLNNINEFKEFLTTQYANGTPVIVEYELADSALEDNIIPYTQTQQSQYNAIKQARSYDDITYITSTSDELGFNMEAIAIADANKVIDNQNSEIDTIKSRLDLLEG